MFVTVGLQFSRVASTSNGAESLASVFVTIVPFHSSIRRRIVAHVKGQREVPPCSKHLVLCLPPLVAHVDGQRAFPPCSGHQPFFFPALVRHVKGQRADPPWVRQYAFFLDRDILSVHVDGQRLPTPCSLQKVARLAAVLLMIHQSGQSVSPRFLGCTSTSLLASFLLFADVVGTNAAVVSIEGCCGYQGNI